jgi:hypothetical protein
LYYVDWGDGNGIWLGPHLSGDEVAVSHTWTEKGSYDVSVKAQDSHGLQSSWGTLRVSMPKTYENPLRELIEKLLDLFEHLFGRVITLGIFDL